ncbi:trypsin-like peptidase domain-containing protein [Streptomyces sp. S3(2020)]|uniref:S1 family peptidase n=1 Tax=Streptomyces sp. S3(2020) TaxID=2732044 RepID=UPI00148808BF|nr:serine protease [Streptomyces sp. S3(2020)]NNN32163.1 trypsin-like peptidase domain-containing protein [Streptomyces sp. S3(2020)]
MSVDQSRVVEVMSVAFGSGFRVAPRLVLTSGHVTGPVSDRSVRLRFLDDDTVVEGRVVWQRDDSWLDAALIELDGAEPAPRPPVRFGRFTGSSRRADCEIWGFPRGLRRPFREVVQLAGTVNPGTLGIGRRHQVTLSDAVPRKGVEADRSPWQGVSGGPVFSDDGLLIGIVEHDPVEYDSDVLEAVPLAELIRDAGFRETVERHLDGPLRLESVELAGLLAQPVPRPLNSPGFLIRAETEAVRFRGRTGILDDLTAWCTMSA